MRDLSPKLGNGPLRSRDHISIPPSIQKLMSGSADSRSLALYFTHVHLRAIRPSGEMLAGAHFMYTEGSSIFFTCRLPVTVAGSTFTVSLPFGLPEK